MLSSSYRTAMAQQGASASSRTARNPSSPSPKGSGSSTPKGSASNGRARATTVTSISRTPGPSSSPPTSTREVDRGGVTPLLSTSPHDVAISSAVPPKHPRGVEDVSVSNGSAAEAAYDLRTPAGLPSPVVSQPSSPSVLPPPYPTGAASMAPLLSPTSSSASARGRSQTTPFLQVSTSRPPSGPVALPPPADSLPRASTATSGTGIGSDGIVSGAVPQPTSPQSSQSGSLSSLTVRHAVPFPGSVSHSQPVSPQVARGRPLLLSTLLPSLFSSASSASHVTTSPARAAYSSPPRKPLPSATASASTTASSPSTATPPAAGAAALSGHSTVTAESLHLSPGMSQLLAIGNKKKEVENEKRRQEVEEDEQRRRADLSKLPSSTPMQPLNLHDLEPRLLQLQHERQSQSDDLQDGDADADAHTSHPLTDGHADVIQQLTRGPASDGGYRAPVGNDLALPALLSGVVLMGVSAWAGWRWIVQQQRRLKR